MSNGPKTIVTATFNIEVGSVIAGRYEVKDKIGAGGMGVVLKVVDRELNDELVAVKLLHPHLAQDETVFRRFRNEVLVARSLTHPNIVRLHDIGRAEEGFSYISMEFVDGVSLKDLITPETGHSGDTQLGQPSLGFEKAVSVLLQVMSGVAYAHAKGVIHRDLKPANVLISNSGEVKLADFGTARILGMDNSLTQTGQSIGTPDYMAPEQIRGEPLDAACDIYALGIIAYELIVGARPFVADSAVAVAFKHMNEPIPEFATPENRIPLWYQEVVKKATAKEKKDRFPTVNEFIQAISEHVPEIYGAKVANVTHTLGIGAQAYSSKTSRDEGFQLGDVKRSSSSGDWNLGTSGTTKEQLPNMRKRSFGPYAVGFVVAVLCVAGLFYFVPQVRDAVLNNNQNLLGEDRENPETSASTVAPKRSEESNRADLEKELLASLPGNDWEKKDVAGPSDRAGSSSTAELSSSTSLEVTGSSSVVEASSSSSAEQSSSAEPVSSSTSSAVVSSSSSAEVTPVTTTTLPVVVEPPKPKYATSVANHSLSVTMVFRNGPQGLAGEEFDIANVSRLRWEGSVLGLEKLSPEDMAKTLQEDFAVNVFDLGESVLVARTKPIAEVDGQTTGKLKVELGSLNAFPKRSGHYRLDLLRGGEVLASREFQLKGQESTAVSEPQPTIVSRTPVVTPPTMTLPRNLPQVTTPQVNENGFPLAAGTPPQLPRNVDSLPIAEGYGSAQGERLPSMEMQEQVTNVVAMNYRGTISTDLGGAGGSGSQHSLLLNLNVQEDNFTGSGTLDGSTVLKVSGKFLARGVEIYLSSENVQFRLTGVRRDTGMRGTYVDIIQKKRGSWELTKIQ